MMGQGRLLIYHRAEARVRAVKYHIPLLIDIRIQPTVDVSQSKQNHWQQQ
jgi:hypothetical protein